MAKKNTATNCEIDRLFMKNVPHVLEKIFFSLDFDSIISCRAVCESWNQLHSSDLYWAKANEKLIEKKENQKKLCFHSWKGNAEEVRRIISSGINPNLSWADAKALGKGAIPLLHAIIRGHDDVVKVLLDMGADPNRGTENGLTPLNFVKLHGNSTGVVKLLLEAGADPNKGNDNGIKPLHLAAGTCHTEMVRLLLDAGADPNAATVTGETPLLWATEHGHEDSVQLLMDRGGGKLNSPKKP